MTWIVYNEGVAVGKHDRITVDANLLKGRDRNDRIQTIYSPRGWTSVKYED